MGLAFSGVTHCRECGRSLSNNEYVICNSCEEKREQDKNITTHHTRIKTEKLRELIHEHYKWNEYTLTDKIEIVTSLAYFNNAYFNNDRELLEFLIFMEDNLDEYKDIK